MPTDTTPEPAKPATLAAAPSVQAPPRCDHQAHEADAEDQPAQQCRTRGPQGRDGEHLVNDIQHGAIHGDLGTVEEDDVAVDDCTDTIDRLLTHTIDARRARTAAPPSKQREACSR